MTSRYKEVKMADHPRTKSNGYVYEQILIAEAALGKYLPAGVEVHHINGMRADNRPTNLVICQDHKYHMLLHVRMRVLRAGGVPGRDKICGRCQQVKPLGSFPGARSEGDGLNSRCRSCHVDAQLARKRRRCEEMANGGS